jgi:anti-sigma B factor antagonist
LNSHDFVMEETMTLDISGETVVSQLPGHLDVFWVGSDGAIWTQWWDKNATWSTHSPFRIARNFPAPPQANKVAIVINLTIQQQECEGVVILRLEGRLAAGEEAAAVRRHVEALRIAGSKRVVLDLSGVNYVDSTGLGSLLLCNTSLSAEGGGLRLLSPDARARRALTLTGLTTVFELYSDEQDACDSFLTV